MGVEDDFTNALIDAYRRSGEETGYWARRFLAAVRRHGGLSTAKRMLKPRTAGQRAGLDTLLEAGRPDLTIEAIILRPEYRGLFTEAELATAEQRLGDYARRSDRIRSERERLYPDELEPGLQYTEGARKSVRVNAAERNLRARRACIASHGHVCSVCGLDFGQRYGEVGVGFIHVHHVKPLSLTDTEYTVDPVNDLRPVCPNCHAMLHRTEPVLTIEQLRERLRD